MAAGTLITVLSNIPWGKVLEAAPKVAEGAAKLWSAVRDRSERDSIEDRIEASATHPIGTEAEILKQRVAELERDVRSLQEQMQAATEFIKTLAEQNTLFVQRVELNRTRLFRLGMATIAIGTALLGVIIYAIA
ncbi:hypothetical protein [Sphaerotilus mobilis]|uniref:Uncharacterized protein n=1 Tax=Sphaerotilus mobilis TaxID=47994 RepID=A0A4Q7L9F9_9BURK|nr:hypothetical protein [Sphaerotilus mobilis]RZS46634.1 hypothetical protein EV685_4051 [Sphaerotilus mobilis]